MGAARLKKGALLALGRRGSVTSRPKRSGEWADGVGRWCRRWGEPRVVALESVGVAQRRTGRAARSQAIRDRRRERTASGTVRTNKQVYRSTPYVPTHRAFANRPADAAHHSPPAPPAGPSARTPKMGPAPAASPRWAPVTPAQPSELLVLGSGCAGGEELVNSNPRTLEPMPRPLRRPPPPPPPPRRPKLRPHPLPVPAALTMSRMMAEAVTSSATAAATARAAQGEATAGVSMCAQ